MKTRKTFLPLSLVLSGIVLLESCGPVAGSSPWELTDREVNYRSVCSARGAVLQTDPDPNSRVLATAARGELVRFFGDTRGDWAWVEFDGVEGWVDNRAPEGSTLCLPIYSFRQVCANHKSHIRTAPRADAPVLATMGSREVFRYYERASSNQGWIFVRTHEQPEAFGWVDTADVCFMDVEREICNAGATDLWSEPSFSSRKQKKLPRGTRIRMRDKAIEGEWILASVGNQQGWVHGNYVCNPTPKGDWTIPVVNPATCVTSPFDLDRFHPVLGIERAHLGLDMRVYFDGRLAPVAAAAAGVVQTVSWAEGYGRLVEIDHGNGWVTRYGHLDRFLTGRGAQVRAGTHIAVGGNSGLSNGPHLHFEVLYNGMHMDPRSVLRDKAGKWVPDCP